jgi:hypothetical protein
MSSNLIKLLILPFISIVLCCQRGNKTESESQNNLSKQILGTWKNVSLTVEIQSRAGIQDSSDVFEVKEGQWEEILQIRPIHTTYLDDSSFSSVYRDLNDSIVNSSQGKWYTQGDSLFLQIDQTTFSYHTLITGDTGIFRGYLDWDSDNASDDLYYGVQLKVPQP